MIYAHPVSAVGGRQLRRQNSCADEGEERSRAIQGERDDGDGQGIDEVDEDTVDHGDPRQG